MSVSHGSYGDQCQQQQQGAALYPTPSAANHTWSSSSASSTSTATTAAISSAPTTSDTHWPSTSSTTKAAPHVFPDNERRIASSDMPVLPLIQPQNESFLANTPKLPSDVMRYHQSASNSFSSDLKNDDLSHVTKSFNENSRLPVVFSSQISPLHHHPSSSLIKSNLTRHRSSPATLLSQLAVETRGVTGSNGNAHSAQHSSSFMRSSTGDLAAVISTEGSGLSGIAEAPEFSEDIDATGWDGSTMSHGSSLMSMLDDVSPGRKRYPELDGDQTLDAPRFEVDGKALESPGLLTRHHSLPVVLRRESDLVLSDNWLQDSVPCRLRAKRGCATHPRSIAERVRRTRISERMRKLQELVPNMDKQTNITDMLDEAIEYVKFLQHQVQELSESTGKCRGLCKLDANSNDKP